MNRDVIIQCLKICAEAGGIACEGCAYEEKPSCYKMLLQDTVKILEADAEIEKELYEEKSFRLFLMYNVPHIEWTYCKDKMPKEGGHYRVAAWWRGGIVISEDDFYSYGWDDYGDSVFAWSEIPKPEHILVPPVIRDEMQKDAFDERKQLPRMYQSVWETKKKELEREEQGNDGYKGTD